MKTRAVAPGWYPAPDGAPLHVYWDGGAWTAHTRPAPDEYQQQMLAAVRAGARHAETTSQIQVAVVTLVVGVAVIALLLVLLLN